MPEQNTAISKIAHLDVTSDLTALPKVVDWFAQFQVTSVPRAIWLQGNMALIEGFTNAVRHAHRSLSSSTPIVMQAVLLEDCLQFEIWDQGDPYNFDEAITQLQQTIEDPTFDPLLREKHWGSVIFLNLIRQHHWSIGYFRVGDSRNCLRAKVNFLNV